MRYRLSKYNFFLIKKDRVVGLNLKTGIYFSVSPEYYHILVNNKQHPEKLEQINRDLFVLMYKLGVICHSPEKQEEIFLFNNRKKVFNRDNYLLIINPTLNCNFSCWYCYETHNKKKMSLKVLESLKKHLEKKIKLQKGDTKQLSISWFGGEPLLNWEKIMLPLTKFAQKICDEKKVLFSSGITTNGYLINRDMIRFFKLYNFRQIQITLDGNRAQHDSTRFVKARRPISTYNVITQNIRDLLDHIPDLIVTLRINFTSATIDTCKDVMSTFSSSYRTRIKIMPVQIWQDRKKKQVDYRHIHDLKEYLRKEGYLIDENIFNKKEYTCYADLNEQAVINYDGKVYKCTARDFKDDNWEGQLTADGDILWDDQKVARRLSRATFDNEKCLHCNYLPVCFGDCSQKRFMDNDQDDHLKTCPNKKEIKQKIFIQMEEFYKSGMKIATM